MNKKIVVIHFFDNFGFDQKGNKSFEYRTEDRATFAKINLRIFLGKKKVAYEYG